MSRFLLIIRNKSRSEDFRDMLKQKDNEVIETHAMDEKARELLFVEKPDIIVINRSNPDISRFLDTKDALGWVEFRQEFFRGYFVNKYPPEIMEITDETIPSEFRYM